MRPVLIAIAALRKQFTVKKDFITFAGYSYLQMG